MLQPRFHSTLERLEHEQLVERQRREAAYHARDHVAHQRMSRFGGCQCCQCLRARQEEDDKR